MDIFDLLKLIGGLCLFLFGMNIMGDALERRAGESDYDQNFRFYKEKYSLKPMA